jgi:hypothetical protein
MLKNCERRTVGIASQDGVTPAGSEAFRNRTQHIALAYLTGSI